MKKLRLYDLKKMIKNGCSHTYDTVTYEDCDVVWLHELETLQGSEVEIHAQDEYFHYVYKNDCNIQVLRCLNGIAYDIIECEEEEI